MLVSSGSLLGAMVRECGALLVDHGWLRILGAGAAGLPGVRADLEQQLRETPDGSEFRLEGTE